MPAWNLLLERTTPELRPLPRMPQTSESKKLDEQPGATANSGANPL